MTTAAKLELTMKLARAAMQTLAQGTTPQAILSDDSRINTQRDEIAKAAWKLTEAMLNEAPAYVKKFLDGSPTIR